MPTVVTLPIHDSFTRGGYPASLDGSTSTSGHTWDADPEFLIDINIEGPPGDAYAYSDQIDGGYNGQFSIGTIDHGYADGVICGVPNNVQSFWHRLIFRYVDDNNYSFVDVDDTGGPFGTTRLVNRVSAVNTTVDSTNSFAQGYLEVRMNGTAIEVWQSAGPSIAPSHSLDGVITQRTGATRHGLASNENGDDPGIGVFRANWLSFGYRTIAALAQTSARTKHFRHGSLA